MTAVVGLDLSLTSSGLALVRNGKVSDIGNVKSSGKKGDDHTVFLNRIKAIAFDIDCHIYAWLNMLGRIDLAVMEGPSHGSKYGNPHERAGLWWQVFDNLTTRGITIAQVAPATRAKYITGNGRADKKLVLAEARSTYTSIIPNDDVADAVGLAAMGSRALGAPVEESLGEANLVAFKGVSWPSLERAA